MATVTKDLTWQQLDITTMTNLYLYGQMTTPANKIDEALIRTPDEFKPDGSVKNPQVVVNITNVDDFMKNGPGRFANASQFGLISSFMNGGVVNTVGEYDINTIAPKVSDGNGGFKFPDNRRFSVQQYNYTDAKNDSATRIYSYGSTSFVIRSGTLVVSANGDRYIKNLVIAPFEDNFDFESNQGVTQYVDPTIKDWFDPVDIGRQVKISYQANIESIVPIIYSSSDYTMDFMLFGSTTNVGSALPITINARSNLWDNKTTYFVDSQGRAIIYGTDGNDIVSYSKVQTLNFLAPMYRNTSESNGVVLIGGKGTDILDGTSVSDYLLGGQDFDTYYSGNGDTIKDTDNNGRVLFEGFKLTGGVSETGCKPNGDGEYRGDGGVYKLSSGKLTFTKDGTNETLTIEKFVNGALGIILTSKDPGASCPPPMPNPEPDDLPTPSTPNPNFPSPLVLDLNGDGVTSTFISSTSTYFDLDNDGVKQRTGWVQTTDALLALDKNQDGIINNASELFGNHTTLKNGTKAANGFEALKEYDENRDGVIDSKDNIYNTLSLWQDANSDGVTDTGELHSLTELGVASINLGYTQTTDYEEQNRIFQTSSFTTTDGSTQSINDVWFATESRDTARDTDVTLKDTVAVLPDFRGAGRAGNLSTAMNSNTKLETAVTALLTKSTTSTYASLLGDVKNILALWTHTDNISATAARGEQYIMNHNYANPQQSGWRYRVFAYARDIAILEAFWGQNFTMNVDGKTTGDVIGTEMSNYMTNAIETLTDTVLATLLVQQLYGKEAYNVTQGQFDYSALFTKLDTTLTAGNAEDKITASNLLATLIHRDGLGILFHLDTALLSDSTFKSLLSTNGITYTINADGSISGSYAGTVEGSSGSATKASVNRKKYKSENEREAA